MRAFYRIDVRFFENGEPRSIDRNYLRWKFWIALVLLKIVCSIDGTNLTFTVKKHEK
jgi:hypothetical protein